MQNIWNRILKATHIAITMHKNPDGDAIGSALGLYSVLANIKKTSLFNSSHELPREYSFLNGFDKIKQIEPKNYDLLICLDSSSFSLIGIEKPSVDIINIDHHENNEKYGTFNLINHTRPSCAEVVFELLKANDIKPNRPSANALYAGLVSDTQFFSTSKVDEESFDTAKNLISFGAEINTISKNIKQNISLAKARLYGEVFSNFSLFLDGMVSSVVIDENMQKRTGISLVDTKNISSDILALSTVEASIMIFIINYKEIKISLRSKGVVDVLKIAQKYGGNGHKNAAGAYIKDISADELEKKLIEELRKELNEKFSL